MEECFYVLINTSTGGYVREGAERGETRDVLKAKKFATEVAARKDAEQSERPLMVYA